MYNTITKTITKTIANIFSDNTMSMSDYLDLKQDAINHAVGIMVDGTVDAKMTDDNVVEGWFDTMTDDVYVEIMYLTDTDETIYTIGNFMSNNMQQMVVTDLGDAIEIFAQYLIVGVK